MRLKLLLAVAAGATTLLATQVSATSFYINYSGTSATTGAFSAALTGDETNGHINTITGTRTTGSVTYTVGGLSPYASADQQIIGVFPFADFSGISYSTSDGNNYNFYKDSTGLFELNSKLNPGGYASADAPITSVSSAVPETATWAMMLVGFGLVGFGMRRRSSVRTAVSFA